MSDLTPRILDRTIAGWSLQTILIGILLMAGTLWGAWITRTLVEVRSRHIVTVSLSRLVEDFVASEARGGGTSDQSAKRTAVYLAAINQAVSNLGEDGATVLVSEATLGRSVPDRTELVRARVRQAVEASRDPR
ncbi:TrbI F-type domain-containing protein [Sphingomonas profundi]|uniref:TrbI F-type domain-containing protein n=1 Tax=Alterirhizorhabdus profundi TaxID=2681549 RepID=UPI0012E75048|nr:TrbI F-type domain-containing protein [Sphingomonas profundi]